MHKIAFLFLTRDNLTAPQIWNSFFSNIDNDLYSIYCHPKFPSKVTDSLLKNNIINTTIFTNWGHISCVQAYLLLFEEALKDPLNSFFITLSESCIPILNFNEIHSIITNNDKSFLNFYRNCEYRWKHMSDKNFISYDKFLKNKFQGLAFNRDLSTFFINHKHFQIFNSIPCPEEHYFINILLHYNYDLNKINNICLTFIDWSISENGGKSPRSFNKISSEFLQSIRNKNFCFMRKINKNCVFYDTFIQEIQEVPNLIN